MIENFNDEEIQNLINELLNAQEEYDRAINNFFNKEKNYNFAIIKQVFTNLDNHININIFNDIVDLTQYNEKQDYIKWLSFLNEPAIFQKELEFSSETVEELLCFYYNIQGNLNDAIISMIKLFGWNIVLIPCDENTQNTYQKTCGLLNINKIGKILIKIKNDIHLIYLDMDNLILDKE